MLSNSNTEFVRMLYKQYGFYITVIQAQRLINCDADRRGTTEELLITNF